MYLKSGGWVRGKGQSLRMTRMVDIALQGQKPGQGGKLDMCTGVRISVSPLWRAKWYCWAEITSIPSGLCNDEIPNGSPK